MVLEFLSELMSVFFQFTFIENLFCVFGIVFLVIEGYKSEEQEDKVWF